MDADLVKRIAGETDEKAIERDAVSRRLAVLENGARICKQYAKQPQACELFPKYSPKNLRLVSSVVPESKQKTESEIVVETQQKSEKKREATPLKRLPDWPVPARFSDVPAFGVPAFSQPTTLNTPKLNRPQITGQPFGFEAYASLDSPFGLSGASCLESTSTKPFVFSSLPSKSGGTTASIPFGCSSPERKSPFESSPAVNISSVSKSSNVEAGNDSESAISDDSYGS